jgi:hypothetical protein
MLADNATGATFQAAIAVVGDLISLPYIELRRAHDDTWPILAGQAQLPLNHDVRFWVGLVFQCLELEI